MLRSIAVACFSLLLLCCTSGCDDADASNLRIKLNADFSGTVRATRLVIPTQPGQAMSSTTGVTWTAAAQVMSIAGSFPNINEVRVEDITFSGERTPKGLRILRVTMPRGPEARWPAALTMPNKDKRRETNDALNPDQKASRLGSIVEISIELPFPPVSQGVSPQNSAIKASAEKNTVTLSVSVDAGMKAGAEIVWDITWNEPAPK